MGQMTEKMKRFCDEYLIDLNGTQAAIRAGYSKKSADRVACENLQKPVIREYIDERMAQLQSEKIASAEEVLRYLTSVVRGETQSEVTVIEGIGEGCSEARNMEKAPDEKERLKAAELLGKRYGLFTDKVDMAGGLLTVVIKDDYGDEDS